MNITHTEAPDTPTSWPEILRAVFARQRELMDKYQQIENLPSAPVSLHTVNGQRVLKDFAWRSTEELAESFEAYRAKQVADNVHDQDLHELHQVEEIADALHFLVELLIFAGVSVEQCLDRVPEFPAGDKLAEIQQSYWEPVYRLGLAMNFLRNKPWKQSQVPTDEGRCRRALFEAFAAHVQLWADLGLTQDITFNFYFRKSEVNKFRQRSNY